MFNSRSIQKINKCIIRIAGKKESALDELFELTKKDLYVVACSYLYDKSKAEDVLSDSYLKIVKSAASFDRKQNGYNWLYEIVKNAALNQNKKDKLRDGEPLTETNQPSYEFVESLCNRLTRPSRSDGNIFGTRCRNFSETRSEIRKIYKNIQTNVLISIDKRISAEV